MGREKSPQWLQEPDKKRTLMSHQLLKLAELCQISLDEDRRIILKKIGEDVTWRARYPIPKKKNHIKYKDSFSGSSDLQKAFFQDMT